MGKMGELVILSWLCICQADVSAMTADPWYQQGHWSKNPHEEIRCYTKALGLDITKVEKAAAYNHRGTAYAALGRYRRAMQDYSRAIRLKPDFLEAYLNRGNGHYHLEQYQRAIDDYTALIRLKSDYADAYYARGKSYQCLAQHEKAIRDFDYYRQLKSDTEYVRMGRTSSGQIRLYASNDGHLRLWHSVAHAQLKIEHEDEQQGFTMPKERRYWNYPFHRMFPVKWPIGY